MDLNTGVTSMRQKRHKRTAQEEQCIAERERFQRCASGSQYLLQASLLRFSEALKINSFKTIRYATTVVIEISSRAPCKVQVTGTAVLLILLLLLYQTATNVRLSFDSSSGAF